MRRPLGVIQALSPSSPLSCPAGPSPSPAGLQCGPDPGALAGGPQGVTPLSPSMPRDSMAAHLA